jgi:putative FmdB family regulatory protein
MPTYDYVCDACDHRFEEFQNITAPVLTKCPECKKKKLRRLFGTGAAIVFKGSGFYQTDYRSEGYKQAQAADGKSGDGGSGGKSGGEKSSGQAASADSGAGAAAASTVSPAKGSSASGSKKSGGQSSGKSDKS